VLLAPVDAELDGRSVRIIPHGVLHGLPFHALERNERVVAERALVSYAPSLAGLFTQAAEYVDKILKGAKPAEMPIAQPTVFELAINLRTAKALGLRLPQSLLQRADRVIE